MIHRDTTEDPPSEESPGLDAEITRVLRRLQGRSVLVVTPDHYEQTPAGCSIRPYCYEAQVLAVKNHHMVLEYYAKVGRGSRTSHEERAREFIPVNKIRRVTITNSRRTIHL